MLQWYAIRTMVNKERRVVNRLDDFPVNLGSIEAYLPAVEKHTYLHLHKTETDGAGGEIILLSGEQQRINSLICPGYVFLRLEMSNTAASWISEIDGVSYIMPSSLRPIALDDDAIKAMRGECDKLLRQTDDMPDLDWMLGKMFKVKDGPYAGRFGPCLSFARDGRPQIAIETVKGRYQSLPFALAAIDLTTDEDAYMAEVARLNERARCRHKRERRKMRAA